MGETLAERVAIRGLRRRYPRLVKIDPPAVGQELLIKVPGGVIWLPIVFRFTFLASAFVGNRFPRYLFDDGSDSFYSASDPNAITANLNTQVHLTWQVNANQQSGSDRHHYVPRMQLGAGWRLRSVTTGLDVGDAFSAITMYGIEVQTSSLSRAEAEELLTDPPVWDNYLATP